MRTIINHPLICATNIMMHVGSKIVKIAYNRHSEPYMLVEADTRQLKQAKRFEIFKHGQEIPERAHYVGAYRNQDQVWCVYDVTEKGQECEACQ